MALSAPVGSKLRTKYGSVRSYEVAASKQIYFGAVVVVALDGSNEGYAMPAYDDADDSEALIVVGVALESKNNSSGSAGDMTVRTRRDYLLKLNCTGADETWLNKLATVADDETVKLYNASEQSNIVAGRIVEVVSSSAVFVNLADRPKRIATGAND